MTLEQTAIGEEVRITKVGGEGELRCRLLDMGLIPKTTVKVQKVAPMGDPIEIHLRGYELTRGSHTPPPSSVASLIITLRRGC